MAGPDMLVGRTIAGNFVVEAHIGRVDPDFNPDRACVVEVRLINAQGERERAVRAALHGVTLAGCYRRALHELHERGRRVEGADFLPGLARCLQGAPIGAGVPRAQVDTKGGTADLTLAFRAP